MYTSTGRKVKINLSDYDFSKDLKNRVLLSQLSPVEALVLQEIVYNSLTFPLSELEEACGLSRDEIETALEPLYSLELFKVEGSTVIVDKEVRKYFEVQIERFRQDFKPDLEFFQGLLSLIPIHILPGWYSLPKTSDNLFESIIERHLATPKMYEKFLYDLFFDDNHSMGIIRELYSSPNFYLDVAQVQKKYGLEREELEALIINLEYNKVCCLCYINEGDSWRQMLTPYEEWREYLIFLQETVSISIPDIENIQCQHNHDFGFVEDIDALLRWMTEKGSISLDSSDNSLCFDRDLKNIGEGLTPENPFYESYRQRILEKLISLRLAEIEEGRLLLTENAPVWLKKPVQEKAMALYFSTINYFRKNGPQESFSDRDIREIEKSLHRVIHGNWVYADDFIAGMSASIGTSGEVALKKRGRRWSYVTPEYTEQQKVFILEVLQNHLFESGMVAIGLHEGKLCFAVTPFGKLSLGH